MTDALGLLFLVVERRSGGCPIICTLGIICKERTLIQRIGRVGSLDDELAEAMGRASAPQER